MGEASIGNRRDGEAERSVEPATNRKARPVTIATTPSIAPPPDTDPPAFAAAMMDAFNRRDFDAVLASLHPDYEAAWPHATLAGLDAVAHEATILDAFPDVAMDVQQAAAIPGGALLELIVRGNNTGPLAMPWGETFPPSGRTLALPMMIVMELDGAHLRCERLYFDQRTILDQTNNL